MWFIRLGLPLRQGVEQNEIGADTFHPQFELFIEQLEPSARQYWRGDAAIATYNKFITIVRLAFWQSTPIDIPVIKRKIRQIIYGRFSLITDTPQQQHEMVFDGQTAAGEDEWYCPTCGRRLLIQWPPAYQRTMINPGDEYAIHTVSKGGLKMTSSQVKQSSSLDLAEMNSLNLWNDLLDQIGFDQWWQRDL